MSSRMYRDSHGKTLADYWRPSLAVDAAVLTLVPDPTRETGLTLAVLQVRRNNGTGWALPGTFLHEGETLAGAVKRSLCEKANVCGLDPQQLHVFDKPGRDRRGRVLSVAHIDVVRAERLASRFPAQTRLMPVHAPGDLPYDHPDIIAFAKEHIQMLYADKPDPDRLLGDEFTLLELRRVHETIGRKDGKKLKRDTFRRIMAPHLVPTDMKIIAGRGRPAELFQRAGDASR